MDTLEVQPVAQSPENNEVVRQFSFGLTPTIAYPDVIHAVADHTAQEREREAAKWRPKFQDPGAAGRMELAKLDVVADQLQRIIKAFPEASGSNDWSLRNAQAAVTDAKQTWENKKRWYGGKTQKKYHDVMCNMNAHSGILSLLPQSNTYVSVVAGAVTTIVKASVNHRRNIEELTRALKEVNDEAQACITDTDLIQSEATQIAIAKFYIALFLFYGDVIKWYQSSSSKKVWHSLNESFADRFTASIDNLKRLSQLVQRAASSGSGAETRVTRLAIEGVDDDLRAGFQGLAREYRELKHAHKLLRIGQEKQTVAIERLQDPKTIEALSDQLWSKAGMSGTALLLNQKENMEADEKLARQAAAIQHQLRLIASPEDPDNDDKQWEALDNPTAMSPLSQSVERLLGLIPQGVRSLDLELPSAFAFDQRITIALERWTRAKTSTLLYLEAAAVCPEVRLPQVSVAATRIINTADELKLPIISFFCDVQPEKNPPSSTDNKVENAAPILGLVYSLIFQLIHVLPPLINTDPLIDMAQVESLDESIAGLPKALGVFSQLLALAPPFLICIIDGFHVFEPSTKNTTHTRDFLSVVRTSMNSEQKVLKFLFTDSRRAFSLIPEIPSESREIMEGIRTGSERMKAPAGRAFVDLKLGN